MSRVSYKFERRSSQTSIVSVWRYPAANIQAKVISVPLLSPLYRMNKSVVFIRRGITSQSNNEFSSCINNGYAHGEEMSTSASLVSYKAGFVFASLLLHNAAILIARLVVLIFAFSVSSHISAQETAKLASTRIDTATKVESVSDEKRVVVLSEVVVTGHTNC